MAILYTYYWFSRYDYSYRTAYTYYVKSLYTCVEAQWGLSFGEAWDEGGYAKYWLQEKIVFPWIGYYPDLYIVDFRPFPLSILEKSNYTYYVDCENGLYQRFNYLAWNTYIPHVNVYVRIYSAIVPKFTKVYYSRSGRRVLLWNWDINYYYNLYLFRNMSGYKTTAYTYYKTYSGSTYQEQTSTYSRIRTESKYTYYSGRTYRYDDLYS